MYHILSKNILPRLPVESIARFRTVSKQWNSLLSSPKFNEPPQQPTEKFLLFPDKSLPIFTTLDCNAPDLALPAPRPLPFHPSSLDQVTILSSIHGLVLVGIRDVDLGRYTRFILWNPTTGDYKNLSDEGSHAKCFDIIKTCFGLYYSCSEDDYKLVCLTCDEGGFIYSLRSDIWRRVKGSKGTGFLRPLPRWSSQPWTASHSVNGKVYFLQHRLGNFFTDKPYSILSFDTVAETLEEISTPSFGGQKTLCPSFTVLESSIHFSVIYHDSSIEVWRLTVDNKWMKVVSYFPQRWFPLFSPSVRPLHVMANGSWLIYEEGYFSIIDFHSSTHDRSRQYDGCIPPRGKYIETLVSPNRYAK